MSTKLPKGLLVERFGGEIFPTDWKVTHEVSGLKLAGPFSSRASATRVARALDGHDWTIPQELIRDTPALVDLVTDIWFREVGIRP
jgi:hypothetical protein